MTSLDRRAFYATKLKSLQKQCEGVKLNGLSLPDTLGYLQKVDQYYSAFVESHHEIVAAAANEEMQNDEGLIGVEIGIVYRDVQSRLNEHISELSPSAAEQVVDLPSQVQAYVIELLLSLPKLQQPTTAANICELNDGIDNILMQLRVMNVPIQQWTDDFIFAITQCMDASTYQAWESHHDHKMPTLQVICDFLVDRARNIDGTKIKRSKAVRGDIVKFPCLECQQSHPLHRCVRLPPMLNEAPFLVHIDDPTLIGRSEVYVRRTDDRTLCPLCTKEHRMYRCPEFLAGSLRERWHHAINLGVCLNCLRPGHSSFKCQSEGACKRCGTRHNSLLCEHHPCNK